MLTSRTSTKIRVIARHKSKDFSSITAIGRPALERLPIVCRTEIEAPIVSDALSLETNRESKLQGLLPKRLIHNQAPGAIAPPIFPMNRRLCSSLAIGAFGQVPAVSTPFDCGISALVDRRRLSPISSIKASRTPVFNSLPHENEMFEDFACLKTEYVG